MDGYHAARWPPWGPVSLSRPDHARPSLVVLRPLLDGRTVAGRRADLPLGQLTEVLGPPIRVLALHPLVGGLDVAPALLGLQPLGDVGQQRAHRCAAGPREVGQPIPGQTVDLDRRDGHTKEYTEQGYRRHHDDEDPAQSLWLPRRRAASC